MYLECTILDTNIVFFLREDLMLITLEYIRLEGLVDLK